MERTGHRSIEGVRTYKHTNKDQEQVVSNLLQRNNNQVQLSSTTNNTIELNNQQKQLPPQFVQLQGCTGINTMINVNNSASEVIQYSFTFIYMYISMNYLKFVLWGE